MIDDEEPDKNSLAIPDTRPNMFLFVPYELAVVFGMLFFAIDTQMHSIKNGFIVIPFWIAAAALVKRDPNGVRVFMVRCRLVLLYLDSYRWGGLSVSPLGSKREGGSIQSLMAKLRLLWMKERRHAV